VSYGSAEYMMLFIKASDYPALIQQSFGGLLPQNLLGGTNINRDEYSGLRLRFGMWCDEHHGFGIEGSYFGMGDASNQVFVQSAGVPRLTVPLIGAPVNIAQTPTAGSIQATMRTQFQGGDVNLRRNWLLGSNWHVDVIAGFRYMGLEDDFTFVTQSVTGPLNVTTNDQIRTRNRFYGGQIGAVGEWEFGDWTLGFRSASAYGYTYQMIDTMGSFRTNVPGLNGNTGLLTAGINRQDSRSRGGFQQEVGASIGYNVSECFRVTGGYNLFYWNNVVRPGEQIDVVRGQPGRPAFNRQTTDFWAQGFTLGLEFRY